MANGDKINAVEMYRVDEMAWRVKILLNGRPRYASERMWADEAALFAVGVQDEAFARGKYLQLILPKGITIPQINEAMQCLKQ